MAGGAIVVDGLFRLGHSISDAANGTVTDAPLSALMQKAGVSRETANHIDTGVSLLATVPVGVGGAALTVAKSSSMLLKGSGLLGGLVVADGAQAGTRSIITNEAVQPLRCPAVDQRGGSRKPSKLCDRPRQSGCIGGSRTPPKVRSPGTVKSEFVTYDPANLPEGSHHRDRQPGTPRGLAHAWRNRKTCARKLPWKRLGPMLTPPTDPAIRELDAEQPLVVLKTVADDGTHTVVGAATVKTNTSGLFGRDPLGQ